MSSGSLKDASGNYLPKSNCSHVLSTDILAIGSFLFGTKSVSSSSVHKHRVDACHDCGKQTVNLWRCLEKSCSFVGCGEKYEDHSQIHATVKSHALMLNLGTKRAWCILCHSEVYLFNNQPPVPHVNTLKAQATTSAPTTGTQSVQGRTTPSVVSEKGVKNSPSCSSLYSLNADNPLIPSPQGYGDEESVGSADDNSSDTSSGRMDSRSFTQVNPVGLTGLKNLGNTCYLNAAVQALSACVPLTNYFLTAFAYTGDEKPPISVFYHQMLTDIWSEKRPSFMIPNTFVQGFKVVNPAFRGYNQQDCQEFLRCFMDRLHEELKIPILAPVCIACGGRITQNEFEQFPQFCESCLHSLTLRQREDIAHESISNYEEHFDGSSGSLAVGAVSQTTSDSGFAETPLTYSTTPPNRRSPDIHQPSSQSMSTSPAASLRGGDRRRTISLSSPCTTMLKNERKRKPMPMQYTSVISETFNGKLLSCVQCLHCHQTSEISETFQDLSLPIPNKEDLYLIHHQPQISAILTNSSASSNNPLSPSSVSRNTNPCANSYNSQGWIAWIYDWIRSLLWGPVITLHDCLAAFFSADELKGENMYSCEKCQKLRNGLKVSKLQELPEILCVHLKRFRHEYLLSSKISTYVSFPMEGLSLAPFLNDANQPATYDLVSAICHYGYASGGHYTAYALNDVNKCWYEFDDQIVTQVPESQVQKAEVYVLFYRKRATAEIVSQRKQVKMRNRAARSDEKIQNVNEIAKSMKDQRDDVTSPTPAIHQPRPTGSCSSLYSYGSVGHSGSLKSSGTGVVAGSFKSQKSRTLSVGSSLNYCGRLMQYYISKQWLNKFLTFANPGPISNSDFLCAHNRIPPEYVSVVDNLTEEVPSTVWEYLYEHFGGGPVVNHLHVCAICKKEKEDLETKRNKEREVFQKLNSDFRSQKCPAESYLIDMRWYKDWEAFARGKADPPGPIDNSAIQARGGRYSSSDYDVGQISADTWKFLLSIYGGGPEIVHKNDVSAAAGAVVDT